MAKVLVADDDPDIVEICSEVLENAGYEVDTVLNGWDVVDRVSEQGVDLVLLDVMMPFMDGLSVCKLLKRDPQTRDLPVVIMSASEVLVSKGRECNADAVVIKPFDIDFLLDTVSHLVAAG